MIQNGPTPFVHPVTGMRIEAYQFYEGNAHLEHENGMGDEILLQEGENSSEESSEPEDAKPKGKKKPKEGE